MNDFFSLSTALNGKILLRKKGLPRSSLAKARFGAGLGLPQGLQALNKCIGMCRAAAVCNVN